MTAGGGGEGPFAYRIPVLSRPNKSFRSCTGSESVLSPVPIFRRGPMIPALLASSILLAFTAGVAFGRLL